MPNTTLNYGLNIPIVGDTVPQTIFTGIGESNTIIDTQLKTRENADILLQNNITTGNTTLDNKIDNLHIELSNEDAITNIRITNLVLNSAPLPEVAAQEVIDARVSGVTGEIYAVLKDRLDAMENNSYDTLKNALGGF